MIELRPEHFIGKGAHKHCYVHPEKNDFCIKIANEHCFKEVKKELNYYKHLKATHSLTDVLPDYYGQVETNLGPGYVYDIIRDYNGDISKPVDFYFQDKEETESLKKAFLELADSLLINNIVTRSLKERNILYQHTAPGESKLVIVDDIGPTELIPITNYVSLFARKKIKRKLYEFRELLTKKYPGNKVVANILTLQPCNLKFYQKKYIDDVMPT